MPSKKANSSDSTTNDTKLNLTKDLQDTKKIRNNEEEASQTLEVSEQSGEEAPRTPEVSEQSEEEASQTLEVSEQSGEEASQTLEVSEQSGEEASRTPEVSEQSGEEASQTLEMSEQSEEEASRTPEVSEQFEKENFKTPNRYEQNENNSNVQNSQTKKDNSSYQINSVAKRKSYSSVQKKAEISSLRNKDSFREVISQGDLLEYRMKRLIFKMGYFPNIGVELRTTATEESDVITDLDVYGIYLHKDFSSKSIWVDCKSGKAKSHERISWIQGIQSIVHASDIIFVKDNVRYSTKQYARKSKIQILDQRSIENLERNFDIDKDDWRGSWNYRSIHKQHITLSQIQLPMTNYKKIADFITSDYWALDNYSKVKKIITALKDLSQSASLDSVISNIELKAIKWAIYELILLFVLATMNICKELYYFNDLDKKKSLRESLTSSDIPSKTRIEILEAAYRLAYNTIRKQVPDLNHEVVKPNFNLTPPSYFEAYYNLILRITNNPLDYHDILRSLDFIFMEFDLLQKPINFDEIESVLNGKLNVTSIKTVLHFITQITSIPRSIFQLIDDKSMNHS